MITQLDAIEKVSDSLGYLYERWQDEQFYELHEEYKYAIQRTVESIQGAKFLRFLNWQLDWIFEDSRIRTFINLTEGPNTEVHTLVYPPWNRGE